MIRYSTRHTRQFLSQSVYVGWKLASRRSYGSQKQNPVITEENRKRIDIVGTGRKSLFIAAMFKGIPEPSPVTLLCTSNPRIEHFYQQGGNIHILHDDNMYEVPGVGMETLFVGDNNVHLASRPMGTKHFNYGAYVSEPTTETETYNVFTQGQPKLIPDERALYQRPKTNTRQVQRAISTHDFSKSSHFAFYDTRRVEDSLVTKPIVNLTVPTDSISFLPDIIRPLKARLSRESTIFFNWTGSWYLGTLV